MPKLPQTIYVHFEKNARVPYLMADKTLLGAIEDDGPTTVGVYRLVETKQVRKVTKEND